MQISHYIDQKPQTWKNLSFSKIILQKKLKFFETFKEFAMDLVLLKSTKMDTLLSSFCPLAHNESQNSKSF